MYEQGEIKSIFGVPIEEAKKVLILYREGIDNVNRNYAKGFEDGYRKAIDDFDRQFNKCLDDVLRGIEK